MPSVDLHCTVVPAATVVWTPVAPTCHGITVAPGAAALDPPAPA
ncbi:MAG TPA: hypothetical protein VFA79_13075 [Myxococcales bacterium]|nr:hypothetical protein [Myxococcales bacterium]